MISRVRSMTAVAAAAALLATGLATAVFAQGPDVPAAGRRFGHGGRGGGFPLAQLELTDAQREQVREVRQRHREEMEEAGRRLRAAFQAQREAVETFPVNEALIRSTSQTLAAAQTDMALLQARVHGEVWSLLTAEQQAKAAELKQQRAERAKRWGQRRPRR